MNIFNDYKDYGYWKFVSYLEDEQENRISGYSELKKLLEKSKVRLRGWDFPHIDTHGSYKNFRGGIQSTCCDPSIVQKVEHWKLFRSGFFAYKRILREDLTDTWGNKNIKKGEYLSLINAVYTITEFILFIKRLYVNMKLEENIVYEIVLGNITNRRLYSFDTNRIPLHGDCLYIDEDNISIKSVVHLVELESNYKNIALEHIIEICHLFNWDRPNVEQIKEDIDNFINKSIY